AIQQARSLVRLQQRADRGHTGPDRQRRLVHRRRVRADTAATRAAEELHRRLGARVAQTADPAGLRTLRPSSQTPNKILSSRSNLRGGRVYASLNVCTEVTLRAIAG